MNLEKITHDTLDELIDYRINKIISESDFNFLNRLGAYSQDWKYVQITIYDEKRFLRILKKISKTNILPEYFLPKISNE